MCQDYRKALFGEREKCVESCVCNPLDKTISHKNLLKLIFKYHLTAKEDESREHKRLYMVRKRSEQAAHRIRENKRKATWKEKEKSTTSDGPQAQLVLRRTILSKRYQIITVSR